ncbi:phytanoyl-CoA dioxygenase, peroxisoma [Acrasis kona]|uniref:Phytanoyl-CoA dioxygenase, peroxisoma n=1 Tax=Acrasis kona TaxID=1008807 RepID=A0AAW2ZGG5_9EUKA
MQKQLLSDEQVLKFIVDGYLVVQPKYQNENINEKVLERYTKLKGNPGNNILPLIPELGEVFDTPEVSGALESLLGPDYQMWVHRYVHASGWTNQHWHKDCQQIPKTNPYICKHHLRDILAFYYPQDTTIELGPTEIRPSTQYSIADWDKHNEKELKLTCPKGTVVLLHNFLVHRGTRNSTLFKTRYACKFSFLRIRDPGDEGGPSWNFKSCPEFPSNDTLAPIYKSIWEWMTNSKLNLNDDLDVTLCKNQLKDNKEKNRLIAAYQLGRQGEFEFLMRSFLNEPNQERAREIAYGLTACVNQIDAVKLLNITLKGATENFVVGSIGFIFSELTIKCDDVIKESIDILINKVNNLQNDEMKYFARTHCCDAIATLCTVKNLEMDYTIVSKFFYDSIQENDVSLRSLSKLGPRVQLSDMSTFEDILYKSGDRYRIGYAIQTLKRINNPQSCNILIRYLEKTRWDYCTTVENPY